MGFRKKVESTQERVIGNSQEEGGEKSQDDSSLNVLTRSGGEASTTQSPREKWERD